MESTILSKEEIRSKLFAIPFVDFPTDSQRDWQTEGRLVRSDRYKEVRIDGQTSIQKDRQTDGRTD